ncbi:MAG TPA: cytosine permease [Syntrophomonas sp.]|nr:cytosine permease [Syntrophomonas sp.]
MADYDDYSVIRVAPEDRRSMWRVTVVRLGYFACTSQLLLGATLGYGMKFWDAFWAVFWGSVILETIGLAVGIMAAKEGMSTSLLTRWSGFGKIGSFLIGLIVAISLTGWFGVQNGITAIGMHQATGWFNVPVWSMITGLALVAIVAYGFKILSWTANIALPLFLLAVGIAAYHMLSGQPLSALIASPAPGPALSFAVATTMVTGGFVVGVATTPDIARFLNKGTDVLWMTIISTFVGELGICLIAVLMAHAAKSSDIITIMITLSGWLGAAIVIFSTLKINDINLYSSSLGLTNAVNIVSRRKISRVTITIILGVIGSILSAIGIVDKFIGFLVLLGVAIPPVVGVMVIDYFILKRHRQELDESKMNSNGLPPETEIWNPIAIISWICGFLIGYFIEAGIPSINSLLAAGIIYYAGMKLYGAATKTSVVQFKKISTME